MFLDYEQTKSGESIQSNGFLTDITVLYTVVAVKFQWHERFSICKPRVEGE
jgi:hypothetical protein